MKNLILIYLSKTIVEKDNVEDWTEEEIDLLFKYYPKIGKKIQKYLPKRTPTACARKANELGIKKLY